MNNLQHSIEINASKEKVWKVLWGDETLRDWANIIDEGTYMEGTLQEGGEVTFMSASGYGVASKIEKMIPNEYVSFLWTSDITVGKDGAIEKRDTQWTGGKENYGLQETNSKVTLSVTQDVPDELVEHFKTKYPEALERVKVLAETK